MACGDLHRLREGILVICGIYGRSRQPHSPQNGARPPYMAETLGRSKGRGAKSKPGQPDCSIKELWVYPLGKNFRQRLLAP